VQVTVYVRSWCSFCFRAVRLLEKKDVTPEVIDVEDVSGAWDEMLERACGRSTVPQVFVGGHHVGGCDDLYDLEWGGQLDALLAEAGKAEDARGATPNP
jgi:glutaredoxin 3